MGIYLKQNKNGAEHTEFSIQKILVQNFMSGAAYMVPNMYYDLGEMDMFLLRRSGYAEEFEIKISTSDLRADHKKQAKHSWLNHTYNTGEAAAKHKVPNRFSYVISDVVDTSNIVLPEYAGLYVVHNDHYLRCLTRPKTMHRHKYNWCEKVAGSCCHRLLRAYKLRNY